MVPSSVEHILREPEVRPWPLPEAYRYCERLTAAHYENFPVASLLVPRAKRPAVSAIYAFARTADDFADEPGLSELQRLDAIVEWRDRLRLCLKGTARHPIFIALGDTVRQFDLDPSLFERLLNAFESDITVRRYQTRTDVLAYCWNSAEPVGRLVLSLFGYHDEDLMRLSDRICTALQLANFWQDLSIDLPKDRVYLPQEDLHRRGIEEANLLQGGTSPSIEALVIEMVEWARQMFWEGRPLLERVGPELKLELRLTYHGGMRILDRVEAGRESILSRRPTLSRLEKLSLLFRSLRGR